MRIAFITAGAGKMYCGACLHDALLIQGLIDAGHELDVYTMYTPAFVDYDDTLLKQKKIFYSGINTYLSQKFEFFRNKIRGVHGFFGLPSVVNFALSFGVSVRPEELGEMTLSVLKGIEGKQALELIEVMEELKAGGKKDLVVITNSLISGLAPEIKKELNIPVVCQLMGEEVFISLLPAPYSEDSIKVLRRNASSVTKFVSPSLEYSFEMAKFLGVALESIAVVPPAVSTALYEDIRPYKGRFTVGYLSKVARVKGLETLIDAFILLKEKHKKDAFLKIAGQILDKDSKEYWEHCKKKLEAAGLAKDYVYSGGLDFKAKKDFLGSVSVFSVPGQFPESRGTAVLEALSAGLPVVSPSQGIYNEIAEKTGGIMLFPAGNATRLAENLNALSLNAKLAEKLSASGRAGVKKYYSQEAMVSAALEAYSKII